MQPGLDDIERMLGALPAEKLQALVKMPGIRERLGATCEITDRQLEAEALMRRLKTMDATDDSPLR